jgi:hypothetical protein
MKWREQPFGDSLLFSSPNLGIRIPGMLDDTLYGQLVAARLLDFFADNTAWPRRLWTIGLALSLEEVLEASQAVQDNVLSRAAFDSLCHSVEVLSGHDFGSGPKEQRKALQEVLRSKPQAESHDFLVLRQIVERLRGDYLLNCARVLEIPPRWPQPERVARGVAAHLLDTGLSPTYLHRWWSYRIHHETGTRDIASLVEEANDLAIRPARDFQILVPIEAVPRRGTDVPEQWLSASEVSEWLDEEGADRSHLRIGGGLLLTVNARDQWAGVERALEVVERVAARLRIGSRAHLVPAKRVWVKGQTDGLVFRRSRRLVEVHSLEREGALYQLGEMTQLDQALELVAHLDTGPPASAVAGGWAAVEALLVGSGDADHRVVSGDRLAAIVTCSFPRAELTALSYAHQEADSASLGASLARTETNLERASLMAQALLRNDPINFGSASHVAAANRMIRILQDPAGSLAEIERYVIDVFRRLYRQRNLVLHWGKTEAVALRATLRTSAPLVGAGFDRIVHASIRRGVTPLELAAQARLQLDLVGSTLARSPLELLE